jgi:hypothetical protein
MTPDELPADMEGRLALLESRCAAIDAHYARFPNSLDRTMEDTAEAIRALLKAYQEQRRALERSESLLRECLGDYGHPNFTDRYGMADRIRTALNQKGDER